MRIQSAVGMLQRVVVARIAPGEDIFLSLEELARRHRIINGLVLGGAASLQCATLRNVRRFPDPFPITDDDRVFTSVEGPLELLSIAGNISHKADDEPYVHVHVTVSKGTPECLTLGGHLVPGSLVLSTCEISIGELSGLDMARKLDDETHAYELVPTELL